MGRIDNVRRIIREDFDKEYHTMIGRLSFVLNTFMEQVVNQMNGNIDFSNLNEELIDVTVKVDAAGLPTKGSQVRTSIVSPRGIVVISAINKTDSTVFPATAPFISFSISNQILKIKHITGLQADNEYDLRIRVIG